MSLTRTAGRTALATLTVVCALITASDLRGAPLFRHAHLVKSAPAANDTLAKSPTSIKLWFSEKVELPVTTVKLADAAGHAAVLAAPARPDTGETAPVSVALSKPLAAGSYVVTWSTAAKDGHPANGTIAFVVKSAR